VVMESENRWQKEGDQLANNHFYCRIERFALVKALKEVLSRCRTPSFYILQMSQTGLILRQILVIDIFTNLRRILAIYAPPFYVSSFQSRIVSA
jgi:hypothetical protein